MVRFHVAFSLLLSVALTARPLDAFHSSTSSSTSRSGIKTRQSAITRRPVASSSSSSSSADDVRLVGEALSSATNAAVDSIMSNLQDTPDLDEAALARRQQLVRGRSTTGVGQTYKVTLPLVGSSSPAARRRLTTTANAGVQQSSTSSKLHKQQEAQTQQQAVSVLDMGIRLCQITRGRHVLMDRQLDLDSLEFKAVLEDAESSSLSSSLDTTNLRRRIDGELQGVVVATVQEGSAGWVAGVRPGDILKTSSATLGTQLWPKSTLEGVRSAVLSRRAVAGSIQLEFQRLAEVVDNQFELTLTRPIGLELKETEDGYVEVTGFTPKASNLVKYAVQIGDRVLAVDSAIGDRMWPVSTVEGVISSVTARLPGQQITFRFERSLSATPASYVERASNSNIIGTNATNLDGTEVASTASVVPVKDDVSVQDDAVVTKKRISDFELLKQCRAILMRYASNEKYVNKFGVSAVVADKVMQTLASAEAKMDPVTLSMVQTAYISSNQPQKAIDAFEAAVGLRADGSIDAIVPTDGPIAGTDDKRIIPTLAALDVYTASSLMKAHKMSGQMTSVERVLAALEGRSGTTIDGRKVATWPGTGEGKLRVDIQCYNIAMSAAADIGTDDGLLLAQQIFDRLSNPGRKALSVDSNGNQAPQKDVVSYNTMIKTLADTGRYNDAIEAFYQMKQFGIQPDKLSYTCLVKAVMVKDDLKELLYDMNEQGVAPDVITFNTVIKDLCQQKKLSAARKVVTLMEASGVTPDSLTYGYLMKGLIDSGNPSAALTLFETACSDRRTVGLTENVHLYTSAVTAAASIGDYTRALEMISRMKAIGVKPNLKTMTALLGACLSAGKPDLAVDVYRSIPNPDFYAVGQGLLAMTQAGNGEQVLKLLSEKGTMAGSLEGKRLMKVYESLFTNAIASEDYGLARRTMMDIMQKGNIPSKTIYQTIFESMGLSPNKSRVSKNSFNTDELAQWNGLDEADMEKFTFLLFLIDALIARNLPCEAPLYTAILSLGQQLGGLPRKISALMVVAKAYAGDIAGMNKLIDDDQCDDRCVVAGWEDLAISYDSVRNQLLDPSSLPKLRVRVSSKEVPRILKAEKNLSYMTPRRRKEV